MINNCSTLFYKISNENNNFIVCLRLYIYELNTIFITVPNSIILLYDKTSEQSFDVMTLYYEKLIQNKNYENIKYVLVGNKKDLIKEEDESVKENNENEIQEKREENEDKDKLQKINEVKKETIEDKNKKLEDEDVDKEINQNNENIDNDTKEEEIKEENEENEDNEKNDENKENNIINNEERNEEKEKEINEEESNKKENELDKMIENEDISIEYKEKRNKSLILSNKIKKFCNEKNIALHKEISGLTGEGVFQLLENVINLLFNDIKNMEYDAKKIDNSLSFYKNNETELNISFSGRSYHSKDYKKEIAKINKKRKVYFCCYRCSIF